MKRIATYLLVFVAIATILNSCKKNDVSENFTENVPPQIPDFVTLVNSAVNGFVTDENGDPIDNALITAGFSSTTTNEYGYFSIPQTAFPKSAGLLKIVKGGFITGFKTIVPNQGAKLFTRITLVTEAVAGNFVSSTGGTVTTNGGAKISIPANAVVIKATGAMYNGLVNVKAHWYDPSAIDITAQTMPGDLTGIDKNGELKILATYGMISVELFAENGEALQLAPNKTATLEFPIPVSLLSSATESIPMWHFDESKGVWIEETTGNKIGNKYLAEVKHFSFWNCDVPSSWVSISAQLLSTTLQPMVNAATIIRHTNNPSNFRYGYTDSEGKVFGYIPANSDLELLVVSPCNNIVVQRFTTNNSNVNIGAIAVDLGNYNGRIWGYAERCNDLPITNGIVIVSGGGSLNYALPIVNGNYDQSMVICPGTNIIATAFDTDLSQQSTAQNYTLQTGDNELDTLTTCTTSVIETISYEIDGVGTQLSLPLHIFYGDYLFAQDSTTIRANNLVTGFEVFNLKFDGASAPGNYGLRINYAIIGNQFYRFQGSPVITITQYGLIGEYIRGTINATILDMSNVSHSFTCTINIRRDS